MTKTAFLTGGSRGIGAATINLLREHGWDVEAPPRSRLDFCDMQSIGAYELDWLNLPEIPKFEALIFCHGEWYSRSLWRPDRDEAQAWYRQFSMRVAGPMMLIHFLLRGDPAWRPASVIMVSSTQGFIGGVNTGPYAAACAAQIALMQGYAREFFGQGVRFNVICPGLTDTEMGRQVVASGGAKPDAVAQPPEAVARLIIELVEDGQSNNGRVVRVVDGQASDARWTWE